MSYDFKTITSDFVKNPDNTYYIIKLLQVNPDFINKYTEDNLNLLMLASKYDNKDLIKYLFKKGVNINEQNKFGFTALAIASANQSNKAIKALLKRGAYRNLKDKKGFIPLDYAKYNNNKKSIELLTEYLPEKIHNDGYSKRRRKISSKKRRKRSSKRRRKSY